jgi:hypothetical protein
MALKDKLNVVEVPADILKYIKEKGIVTPSELQRVFHIGFGRAKEVLAAYELLSKETTAQPIEGVLVEGDQTPAPVPAQPATAIIVAPKAAKKPLKKVHEDIEVKDKQEGEQVLAEVEKAVAELSTTEINLEHSYVHLGAMLARISNNGYYTLLGFPSMAKYIEDLATKYSKGRAQLFGYTSTAKALLPFIDADQLNAIGISKAKELTKAVKATQTRPSDDILAAAIDPKVTIADLRKKLYDLHKVPGTEKGTWYDKLAQGFYATVEEQQALDAAFDKAMRIAGLPEGTPDHMKRKVALYAWAQEFLNVPEASHT